MEALKIVLTVVLCAVVSLVISSSMVNQIGPCEHVCLEPVPMATNHQHTFDGEVLFPMIQNSLLVADKVFTTTETVLKTHNMRLDSHDLFIKRNTLRMNLIDSTVEAQVMLIGEISKEQMRNRKK